MRFLDYLGFVTAPTAMRFTSRPFCSSELEDYRAYSRKIRRFELVENRRAAGDQLLLRSLALLATNLTRVDDDSPKILGP